MSVSTRCMSVRDAWQYQLWLHRGGDDNGKVRPLTKPTVSRSLSARSSRSRSARMKPLRFRLLYCGYHRRFHQQGFEISGRERLPFARIVGEHLPVVDVPNRKCPSARDGHWVRDRHGPVFHSLRLVDASECSEQRMIAERADDHGAVLFVGLNVAVVPSSTVRKLFPRSRCRRLGSDRAEGGTDCAGRPVEFQTLESSQGTEISSSSSSSSSASSSARRASMLD